MKSKLDLTTYYLYVDIKSKKPEKIIFVSLSKSMKELGFQCFKEYSFQDIKKYIYEPDRKKEEQIIKKEAGKKKIFLKHRFIINDYIYIVNIELSLENKNDKYYIYYGINYVKNDKIEYKLLWDLLLKNNKDLILIKYENNKLSFLKNKIASFKNLKKEKVEQILFEKLKPFIEKLKNEKNLVLKEKNFNNFANLKLDNEELEIKISNNNKEISLLFSLFYFKGIENKKEKYFFVLINKNELMYYKIFYLIIKNILLKKKKIEELLFSDKRYEIKIDDYLCLTNYATNKNENEKNKIIIQNKPIYYSLTKLISNQNIKNKIKKFLEFELESIYKEIKETEKLQLLKTIIDKSIEWVIITDNNFNIIYANEQVVKISGYKKEELIGKNPKIFQSGKLKKNFYKKMYNSLNSKGVFEGIFINRDKQGKYFYLNSKIMKINIGNNTFYMSLGIDISKDMSRNDMEYKDNLTGLYNRKGFFKVIKELINDNIFKKYKNFLILDIAKFKVLNHLNGQEYGDKILKELGIYLLDYFSCEDIIARSNSDEFFILTIKEYKEIKNILNLINDKFKNKIFFNVGIFPLKYIEDKVDLNDIINKTNLALEVAKEENYVLQNNIKLYSKNMEIPQDIKARNLIDYGLKEKSFFYQYQPIVDKNGKILAIEPLLRLKKEDKIYYPGDFIEYAEKTDYIAKIDEIMIEKLLSDLEKINNPNILVSFNLAANTISNSKVFSKIIDKINNHKKNKFIFEITERTPLLSEYIKFLKKRNIQISLDDFGTGYSSFLYFADLEIDKLKIDKYFIDRILTDNKIKYIVETIINFSKKLNINTVAEGIETKEQFELLKEMNCSCFQGYYFYKPLNLEQLIEILNKQ